MAQKPNKLILETKDKKKLDKMKKKEVELQHIPVVKKLQYEKASKEAVESTVLDLFYSGYSRAQVRRFIIEQFSLKPKQADTRIASVRNSLKGYLDKQREALVNENVLVLERIIADALDASRYAIAIDAIREMNRMLHVYDEQVNVNINANNYGFDFGIADEQPVEIKDAEEVVDEN